MSNQYPSIVPTGYAGDATDFLKAKVDRSGATRLITGSVTIPASTVTATIVGLFPFQAGFKLSYGSWIYSAAQGSSVTLALGYYYQDSTLTSNTAGYLAASSTAASGGILTPLAVVAGAKVDLTAPGWVVALTGGATTSGPADITFNCLFSYDQSGVSN